MSAAPACIFHEKAEHVDTFLWRFRDKLIIIHVQNIELKLEQVDWPVMLASVCLQYTSNKSMREEKSRQPVGFRMASFCPNSHEADALF